MGCTCQKCKGCCGHTCPIVCYLCTEEGDRHPGPCKYRIEYYYCMEKCFCDSEDDGCHIFWGKSISIISSKHIPKLKSMLVDFGKQPKIISKSFWLILDSWQNNDQYY